MALLVLAVGAPPVSGQESSAAAAAAVERLAALQSEALDLLANGLFAQAEAVLADLAESCPAPAAFNNLAVAQAAQGSYDAARETLEASPAALPGSLAAVRALQRQASGEAGVEDDTIALDLMRIENLAADCGIAAPAAADAPREVQPPPDLAADDGVRQAVDGWAAAWREQRVGDYLGFYSARFRPEGGASRSAWEALRRERVGNPASIELTVWEPVGIEPRDDGTVRVSFRQTYRSDTYEDEVRKTLVLGREAGGWKILSERSE